MNSIITLNHTNKNQKKNNCEYDWDFINKTSDDIVTALGKSKFFCVGLVDIVNSTKTVAKLPSNKVPKYYEIFLNVMAKTVVYHRGEILKIMGDALLFYFPDTCYSERKIGFFDAIKCGFSLMSTHEKLNQILDRHALPQIDFRVSFDYGNVAIIKTRNGLVDLVGTTINTCSKINDLAPTNNIVIGDDLYKKIKHFHEFGFKKTGTFSVGMKQSYPIFTIYKKGKNDDFDKTGDCIQFTHLGH